MNTLCKARILARKLFKKMDLSITPTESPSNIFTENLFKEWNIENEHITHATNVANSCKGYAKLFGVNEQLGYAAGFVHDLDSELFPNEGFKKNTQEHPLIAVSILKRFGYPDLILHAILANEAILQIPFKTMISRILFASDELCKFLEIIKQTQPNASLRSIKWEIIEQKLYNKNLFPGYTKGNIILGAKMLGISTKKEFKSHILRVISFIENDDKIISLPSMQPSFIAPQSGHHHEHHNHESLPFKNPNLKEIYAF